MDVFGQHGNENDLPILGWELTDRQKEIISETYEPRHARAQIAMMVAYSESLLRKGEFEDAKAFLKSEMKMINEEHALKRQKSRRETFRLITSSALSASIAVTLTILAQGQGFLH
jgi:hypothetical protein